MAGDSDSRGKRLTGWFADKKFGVEHALNMYASSFVTMPAMGIYEDDVVKHFAELLSTCHIYLIGQVPKHRLRRGDPGGERTYHQA
jgi:hypothetical protein